MKIHSRTLNSINNKANILSIYKEDLLKIYIKYKNKNGMQQINRLIQIKKLYEMYTNKKFLDHNYNYNQLILLIDNLYEFRSKNKTIISLEYFKIIGLGENEYKKYCNKKTYTMIYETDIELKKLTLNNFVRKYGKDEGLKRFKKRNYLAGKSLRVDYWIEKGYTLSQAKQKLKERQATFSLEKQIYKYGLIQGYINWRIRQNNWQKTLNNKTKIEKEEINKRKNSLYKHNNESIDDYFKRIKKYKFTNYNQFKTIYDLIDYYIVIYKESIKSIKINPENYYDSIFILKYFINKNDFINKINKYYKHNNIFLSKKGKYGTYIIYDNYTFRSFYEFYFYQELKKRNVNFIYEKCYPNSLLKFDFYIPKLKHYIEIAGLMCFKEYRDKMKYKSTKFNAIILKNREDINIYFKKYFN